MATSLQIPPHEVQRRLALDNPWWKAGHGIDAEEESWPRRAYFGQFSRLVREAAVRRAVVLIGPRRVGKTVMLKHLILERDALKWLKPARGQFQTYYKLGTEQPEYIPDFVAESDTTISMVETKARGDINTQEVQAKAAAAARWCAHAFDHAASVGSKP